jgi:hypothetical protein
VYVRVIVLAGFASQIAVLDLFPKGTGNYENGEGNPFALVGLGEE